MVGVIEHHLMIKKLGGKEMNQTINKHYQKKEVEEVFNSACKYCDLIGTSQCDTCPLALTNSID